MIKKADFANGASTNHGEVNADITVIGGGMVGITLALLLAKANPSWKILLIETHSLATEKNQAAYQPSFDARSTALAAGSKLILDQCGVWAELQHHVTPISHVHVSDKGHFGGAQISAEQYGLDAVGYVVENAWLGRVLMSVLQAQKNIQCAAPAKVKVLQPFSAGYKILLDHEHYSAINTKLAVVVDGAHSPLATSLGVQFSVDAYEQIALVANVETSKSHYGIAYERFTDEGPIALLPLGENEYSCTHALVWTLPDSEQYLFTCSDKNFLNALQTRFGFRQGNFVRVSQRFSYPLQLVLAKEQIRRNLVLMGNAAHFLHPVAGQGFNLALRDCATLSKVLKHASEQHASPNNVSLPSKSQKNTKTPVVDLGELSVLQDYIDRQGVDQALTIKMSDQFVRLFSTDQFSQSVLRNMGLFMLDVLPGAGGILAKQTMGMG